MAPYGCPIYGGGVAVRAASPSSYTDEVRPRPGEYRGRGCRSAGWRTAAQSAAGGLAAPVDRRCRTYTALLLHDEPPSSDDRIMTRRRHHDTTVVAVTSSRAIIITRLAVVRTSE